MIWKPSHFFTSLTNKLQESRVFHRFANSLFANQEVKGKHSCSQSNEKPLAKSPCLFFCGEPPCFCYFVCGEKPSFSHCASFNRGSHFVSGWCRLMSGFSGGTDAIRCQGLWAGEQVRVRVGCTGRPRPKKWFSLDCFERMGVKRR